MPLRKDFLTEFSAACILLLHSLEKLQMQMLNYKVSTSMEEYIYRDGTVEFPIIIDLLRQMFFGFKTFDFEIRTSVSHQCGLIFLMSFPLVQFIILTKLSLTKLSLTKLSLDDVTKSSSIYFL